MKRIHVALQRRNSSNGIINDDPDNTTRRTTIGFNLRRKNSTKFTDLTPIIEVIDTDPYSGNDNNNNHNNASVSEHNQISTRNCNNQEDEEQIQIKNRWRGRGISNNMQQRIDNTMAYEFQIERRMLESQQFCSASNILDYPIDFKTDIICSGYLVKKGQNGGRYRRRWFVLKEIYGSGRIVLSYYTEELDGIAVPPPLGVIALKDVSKVELVSTAEEEVKKPENAACHDNVGSSSPYTKKPNCSCSSSSTSNNDSNTNSNSKNDTILPPHQSQPQPKQQQQQQHKFLLHTRERIWELEAATEAEQKAWVEAICNALYLRPLLPPPPPPPRGDS